MPLTPHLKSLTEGYRSSSLSTTKRLDTAHIMILYMMIKFTASKSALPTYRFHCWTCRIFLLASPARCRRENYLKKHKLQTAKVGVRLKWFSYGIYINHTKKFYWMLRSSTRNCRHYHWTGPIHQTASSRIFIRKPLMFNMYHIYAYIPDQLYVACIDEAVSFCDSEYASV